MMNSPYSHERWWVQCSDYRHATKSPTPREVGDVVTSLCGLTVTVIKSPPVRYAPECLNCDRAWRAAENIPQRAERYMHQDDEIERLRHDLAALQKRSLSDSLKLEALQNKNIR